jgi:streptogramin lyase
MPAGIAVGPDGAMWFANLYHPSIGRITTTGKVQAFPGGAFSSFAAGPDGAVWFTTGGIGRITTTVTPAIDNITPTSGTVGTRVTITGHNLAGATHVTFNGKAATIASETSTQIVTQVPTGATTGHISITVPVGTATSSKRFTVT